MRKNESLLGMVGHFATPDDALKAAEIVRDSKYSHFDFLTPFPIHGMEEAMGQKRSWVPLCTVVLVVLGIITAQVMMNYIMVYDWPMNFGGKPFFAWPSFVPITFELMVLFAGIGTAVIAIVAGKKDTVTQPPPMLVKTGATIDKFVLWISAEDPEFSDAEVEDFFKALEADGIRLIEREAQHD